jgi:hypothetical protein
MLWTKFRRLHPSDAQEQIWRQIYPKAIPGYATMDRECQKAERILLRKRVRSCKIQRGRRNRKDIVAPLH